MKGEKTKKLIELAISVAFGSSERNAKAMHDLCVEVEEELTELEHKAQLYDDAKEDLELGKAIRKAYIYGYAMTDEEMNALEIEELLQEFGGTK